jgi:hypothetical protein
MVYAHDHSGSFSYQSFSFRLRRVAPRMGQAPVLVSEAHPPNNHTTARGGGAEKVCALASVPSATEELGRRRGLPWDRETRHRVPRGKRGAQLKCMRGCAAIGGARASASQGPRVRFRGRWRSVQPTERGWQKSR